MELLGSMWIAKLNDLAAKNKKLREEQKLREEKSRDKTSRVDLGEEIVVAQASKPRSSLSEHLPLSGISVK